MAVIIDGNYAICCKANGEMLVGISEHGTEAANEENTVQYDTI